MTRAPLIPFLLGVLVLGAGGRAAAIPQPPHDEATHAVRCANCHLVYADPRVARHDASATGAAATGSSATMLVDGGKAWATDAWVGGAITFTSGANVDQFRTITASDATSVRWTAPLPQPLTAGDTYQLGKITQYDIQDRCWTCHIAGGQAPPASGQGSPALHDPRSGAVVIGCGKCHEPHNVEPSSGAGNDLIRVSVRLPAGGTTTATYPASGNRFITGGPGYAGVCEVCHTQTKYHRNNASGDHAHNAGTPCTQCHKHEKGFKLGACDSCHGAPPATGAHLRHFAGTIEQVQYGDTRITADFAAAPTQDYVFGCGTCHPLDWSRHMDGTVDVELYDATATGTLKGASASSGATYVPGSTALPDPQNPAITYTLGTCGNVYCHSGNGWTAPNVPTPTFELNHPSGASDPLFTVPNPPVFPLTYPAFPLTTTRAYATVGWGDASPGCGGCHGYPPQTSSPTNAAGAGDSHAWIDPYGYENFHNYNMADDPVQCRTCHYDTVTGTATWTRNAMDVTSWVDQPIADARHHVNGTNSVRFDTVDTVTYRAWTATPSPMNLAPAAYDAPTRTCTNVDCHKADTTVRWGTPYRWWNNIECDACHRY